METQGRGDVGEGGEAGGFPGARGGWQCGYSNGAHFCR